MNIFSWETMHAGRGDCDEPGGRRQSGKELCFQDTEIQALLEKV